MGTRRKSRELVLQMLFQCDMGKQTLTRCGTRSGRSIDGHSERSAGLPTICFGWPPIVGARSTELIEGHAEHWRMERMAAVDRNLLRAAVAEFLAYPDTPRAVVINEALEIARKFSSPESVQFVNGVLDSVGKDLAGGAA